MKATLFSGIAGLLFMVGGFYFGLRVAPLPKTPKPSAQAIAANTAAAPVPAYTLETLRKTTESLLDVNQALQARESAVAEREKKAAEREQELDAERAALGRSHAKFRKLYGQFQDRLQLVKASELDQMQRQISLFTEMDSAQAVDLLRGMDDGIVTRLFSLMDVKPLGKMISDWKAKYPADAPRLLADLNAMGLVQPQEKIALPESTAASPPATNPDTTSAPATPLAASTSPANAESAPASPTADTSAPAAAPPPPTPGASSPGDTSSPDPASPANPEKPASVATTRSN